MVANLAVSARKAPNNSFGQLSSDRVYALIRAEILDGTLPPSTRLVELELARRYHVSRTPVREALKRLTTEGLVATDPQRGAVVRTLDFKEVEEIYIIREVLEGLAGRLAAARVTPEDLSRLGLLTGIMQECVTNKDWDRMVQANIKYHQVIYEAAGSPRLASMNQDLQAFVRRFSYPCFASPERGPAVIEEHQDIVRCLETHDADAAEKSSRRHIVAARAYLAKLYVTQAAL